MPADELINARTFAGEATDYCRAAFLTLHEVRHLGASAHKKMVDIFILRALENMNTARSCLQKAHEVLKAEERKKEVVR